MDTTTLIGVMALDQDTENKDMEYVLQWPNYLTKIMEWMDKTLDIALSNQSFPPPLIENEISLDSSATYNPKIYINFLDFWTNIKSKHNEILWIFQWPWNFKYIESTNNITHMSTQQDLIKFYN